MKLSVKEDKKQMMAQTTMTNEVRNLLEDWQVPLLENGGMRALNARTVLVGRRLAKLAALAKVLCTGW